MNDITNENLNNMLDDMLADTSNTNKKRNYKRNIIKKEKSKNEIKQKMERKPKKSKEVLDVEIFKKEKLKIIPLGGIQEIGKNITVFEYGNDIVLVDCGLSFPEDDMLGIDLVIPDFSYLEKNQDRISGLVITPGHEDHIGAIPYLLKQINVPIYATKLTVGLIKIKLEEHKLLKSAKINIVNQGQTIVLGKLRIEFIRSSHSIPDSVMLAITTPSGTIKDIVPNIIFFVSFITRA